MFDFCLEQIADVQHKFGYSTDVESAANELMDEAEELLELLVRLAKRQHFGILQHVFRPLRDWLRREGIYYPEDLSDLS
jgi:hypothetical protein